MTVSGMVVRVVRVGNGLKKYNIIKSGMFKDNMFNITSSSKAWKLD